MTFGIYIHIPFCTVRCDYCAFHSTTGWTRTAQERIVDRIIAHLRDVVVPDHTPVTVYIGGGTPSALPDTLLDRLLGAITDHAPGIVEMTVEANPESLSTSTIETLERNGVTRLSVGVQSMEPAALDAIGRRATTPAQLAEIRRQWPRCLAVDVISGSPGSTTAGTLETLGYLAGLPADHLSVYEISIEPGTTLDDRVSRGLVSVPDRDDWSTVLRRMSTLGYERYEVSNFTRSAPCLHNLGYWTQQSFVGLGPAATGTLYDGVGARRWAQPQNHPAFLEQTSWTDAPVELLTRRDLIVEHLMLGLRLVDGVCRRRFQTRYGRDPSELAPSALTELERDGLVVVTSGHIRATERGLDLLDTVISRLYEEIVSNLDSPVASRYRSVTR